LGNCVYCSRRYPNGQQRNHGQLKIAVFAPIPKASVTTAIKVKIGFFDNIRAP
jgi:hypothetical protein